MPHYDWAWVQDQTEKTVESWRSCRGQVLINGTRFETDKQAERENAYDSALQSVEVELRNARGGVADRALIRPRILAAFGQFSARALNLESDAIELLTSEFLPVGTALALWARQFDSCLSMPDIIQACRNAWTACGLQPLLGTPVQLTPAILGYSLLYPYSDNFLDEQLISTSTKLAFSRRFRQRLRGERLEPSDHREGALWHLIKLIEAQFERPRFPEVYATLLSIHRAQEQSVHQLQTRESYNEAETIRMSCRKGGSSVLADACLVHGHLTGTEAEFAFEWGVLLQLGDDLQDVREDLRRGSMTLFSHAALMGQALDALVVQLLSFAERVGQRMERLPHGSATLKSLLKISWHSLIIRAVADSEQYFSRSFIREAERYSPFRFEFLRDRQQRVASQQGLYGMMFDAFIEDDAGYANLPAPHHREDRAAQARIYPASTLTVLE